MATLKSSFAAGLQNVPDPFGSELQVVKVNIAVSATLAANDILYMMDLPVDTVPVDFILDSTDIDTGGSPSVTLTVGLLNADATDISTAWLTASTIGQAGGMARPTTAACVQTAPRTATPSGSTPTGTQLTKVGVKVAAAGATPAAGTVGLTMFYRAAQGGV